jgi:hypothetical protein
LTDHQHSTVNSVSFYVADLCFVSMFNDPQTWTVLLFCVLQIKRQDLSWWGSLGPLVYQIMERVWIGSFYVVIFKVGFNPFRTGKYPSIDLILKFSNMTWEDISLRHSYVRFEVLKAKTKRYIPWDVTPCNPVKVNWYFWGIYCLHLQNQKVIQAVFSADLCQFLAWLILQHEDGCDILWNVGWLHQTTQHYIPEEKILYIFIHFNLTVLYHRIMKFNYLH